MPLAWLLLPVAVLGFSRISVKSRHAERAGDVYPMTKEYSVYLVSKGRESGTYTARGDSYVDAATKLAAHWNKCNLVGPSYGSSWRVSYRKRKGMPRSHAYLKDERDNTWLLVKRH